MKPRMTEKRGARSPRMVSHVVLAIALGTLACGDAQTLR
jgi:hypothetical protein